MNILRIIIKSLMYIALFCEVICVLCLDSEGYNFYVPAFGFLLGLLILWGIYEKI